MVAGLAGDLFLQVLDRSRRRMNSEELEQRVANWENLHTEFKLEAIHPDDLSAAIVGFANAEGGELIIGVSNDKQIVGVGDTDRLGQYVDTVAFNNSRPPISTVLEIVKYQRRPVGRSHPKGRSTAIFDKPRRLFYRRGTNNRHTGSAESSGRNAPLRGRCYGGDRR